MGYGLSLAFSLAFLGGCGGDRNLEETLAMAGERRGSMRGSSKVSPTPLSTAAPSRASSRKCLSTTPSKGGRLTITSNTTTSSPSRAGQPFPRWIPSGQPGEVFPLLAADAQRPETS